MKKILASLLVLALVAPTMAATVTINDNADGTGTIVVDAGAGNSIVGLALDIDATGGNITALSIDGTANPTFNIYPDAAHDLEVAVPGSYTYGAGTPIADQSAAGEVAVGNNVAISVGCLNGASTPGADGAQTVTINVSVDADTNICVEENALRGGIILTDGTGVDIDGTTVCGDITDVPLECVKDTAPFYAAWVSFGKPDCWCYQKNCRGDYDGVPSGPFRVGIPDLQGFLAAYNQIVLPAGGICADFDHLPSGPFRVGIPDLQTLLQYYNQLDALVPVCDMTNYNFWTN